MGKILKYMTTIALAAVMLFGTMTTAFAVENSGQVVGNDQKGSITIHKYKMPDAENAFESNTENGGIEMDSLPETAEPLTVLTVTALPLATVFSVSVAVDDAATGLI